MITLHCPAGAYIVEKDTRTLKQSKYTGSVRRQKHGGCTGFRREHGFEKQENGAETPYVKEITEPEVEGVIVAAEGGNNAKQQRILPMRS